MELVQEVITPANPGFNGVFIDNESRVFVGPAVIAWRVSIYRDEVGEESSESLPVFSGNWSPLPEGLLGIHEPDGRVNIFGEGVYENLETYQCALDDALESEVGDGVSEPATVQDSTETTENTKQEQELEDRK